MIAVLASPIRMRQEVRPGPQEGLYGPNALGHRPFVRDLNEEPWHYRNSPLGWYGIALFGAVLVSWAPGARYDAARVPLRQEPGADR